MSWSEGSPNMSLGVGMGVGQFGWEQRGGSQDQVLRLFGGVCAGGAGINRRLPPPDDIHGAGRPPWVFPCPVARVPAWEVVSFPSGSGISFQAPSQAPEAREGGEEGGRLV